MNEEKITAFDKPKTSCIVNDEHHINYNGYVDKVHFIFESNEMPMDFDIFLPYHISARDVDIISHDYSMSGITTIHFKYIQESVIPSVREQESEQKES